MSCPFDDWKGAQIGKHFPFSDNYSVDYDQVDSKPPVFGAGRGLRHFDYPIDDAPHRLLKPTINRKVQLEGRLIQFI